MGRGHPGRYELDVAPLADVPAAPELVDVSLPLGDVDVELGAAVTVVSLVEGESVGDCGLGSADVVIVVAADVVVWPCWVDA